eukprot:GHVR01054415.1.p1 GENE.GHVR01054415.1~~GHVR01054415.1.p1  ORF type:complete len:157 (-),score=8.22 GHVR01054415.1:168-638(-)
MQTDDFSSGKESGADRKGRARRSTHSGVKRGRSTSVKPEKKAKDRARIVSGPTKIASAKVASVDMASTSTTVTVSAPCTRPNVLDRPASRPPLTWFLVGKFCRFGCHGQYNCQERSITHFRSIHQPFRCKYSCPGAHQRPRSPVAVLPFQGMSQSS